MPLELAQKRPLTDETLRNQLGRLGDTGMELGALYNKLEGQVILPVSELNRLRRELVEKFPSPPTPGPNSVNSENSVIPSKPQVGGYLSASPPSPPSKNAPPLLL